MKSPVFYLITLLILSSGCENRKKQEEFDKREAALNQREQQLVFREKTIALKEQELLQQQRSSDSSALNDSTGSYNKLVPGNWTTKMSCIETTCSGSAVGDTKVEQWNISYQGNYLLAKAKAGNTLVRVYSGRSSGNTLELSEASDSSNGGATMTTIVRLRIIDEKNMEGQREIVRNNDCKIVYALEMVKE